jgi:hypothetical protein
MNLINLEDVINPKWEEFDAKYKHVHDWRSYVTNEVRHLWFALSFETRVAVIACCEKAASEENWE